MDLRDAQPRRGLIFGHRLRREQTLQRRQRAAATGSGGGLSFGQKLERIGVTWLASKYLLQVQNTFFFAARLN